MFGSKGEFELSACIPVGLALLQANLDVIENSISGSGLQDKKVTSVKSSCNFYFIDQK